MTFFVIADTFFLSLLFYHGKFVSALKHVAEKPKLKVLKTDCKSSGVSTHNLHELNLVKENGHI
jgi:hypothetical protein